MKQQEDQVILSGNEVSRLKSLLKRVHGHYFKDKHLFWNITNFISCSAWNHRWGRKFAMSDVIEKMYKEQLSQVMGRNKNLLSYSRKLKDDNSLLRQENNRLKQIIQNINPTLNI